MPVVKGKSLCLVPVSFSILTSHSTRSFYIHSILRLKKIIDVPLSTKASIEYWHRDFCLENFSVGNSALQLTQEIVHNAR